MGSSPPPSSLEHHFAALSRRQTMLLLTAVTFGGQDALAAFEHLPEDEAELLSHRAAELLQVPRDRRIPLLVQEIKRLVTARRGQLWAADPARLAALLKRERPALVEVVLRALPASLAESVRQFLPPRKAPAIREVRPEVLSIIRWKLEELLTRETPRKAIFKFSDVLLLQSRELATVCDRLGARTLAKALAGLAEESRGAFLERLPPDQRILATQALAKVGDRGLAEEDAAALLDAHGGEENPSETLRSAGTQRLARACLAQSPEFAARVLERHRGAFGQLFGRWVRDERPRAVNLGDGGRADIVAELERLEAQGIIDRPIRLSPPLKRPAPAPAPASRPPQRAELRGDRRQGTGAPSPSGPGRRVDPDRRAAGETLTGGDRRTGPRKVADDRRAGGDRRALERHSEGDSTGSMPGPGRVRREPQTESTVLARAPRASEPSRQRPGPLEERRSFERDRPGAAGGMPPPPPPDAEDTSQTGAGGTRTEPEERPRSRRMTGGEWSLATGRGAATPSPGARRDYMAERAARAAGVASSRDEASNPPRPTEEDEALEDSETSDDESFLRRSREGTAVERPRRKKPGRGPDGGSG